MKQLDILLEIAKLGAHKKPCEISSNQIAEKVGCSQQTASRWLKKLSKKEHIEQKQTGPQGQIIKMTPKGVKWLRSIERDIKKAFEEFKNEILLTGKLVSGFNEGSYYVGRKKYQKQFREKLGFKAHPGTIDLELDAESIEMRTWLETGEGIKIEGFSTEERSFGDVKCFPAELKGEKAAVVMPYRTSHEDRVIEIISPIKIRDKYNLEYGDELEVKVEI